MAHYQEPYKTMNDLLDSLMFPLTVSGQEELMPVNHFVRYSEMGKIDYLLNAMTYIGNASEGFEDALGEVFMTHISHGRLGQYFTPMPICKMMAMMSNIDSTTYGQSVDDPACGSGRMLLAAASINRNMIFNGTDLDATCCKMAAVNLLLNSLTGSITNGDTLAMKMNYVYVTKVDLLTRIPYLQIFRCVNAPEEVSNNPVQLSGGRANGTQGVQSELF